MADASAGTDIVFEQNVPTPARDGTVLRANVVRPRGEGRWPTLVERTPYGKAGPESGIERFARAGYAVVSQDFRGRYASDGEWMPFTDTGTADGNDGYDLVEWVAAQPWSNGRVGAMGASYCSWAAWELARRRPPHLVALAARSIPPDMSDIDWSGGFKPARRLRWWWVTMAPDLRKRQGLPPPHTPQEAARIWDEAERGSKLWLLPLARIVDFLPPVLAESAARWLADPSKPLWRLGEAHAEIAVPNLDITGWYDHCNGTIAHLAGMQKSGRTDAARRGSRLIIGPWNHVAAGKRQQGDVDFGEAADMDVAACLIRWFDHWLKDKENGVGSDPAVRYFVMGAGEWRTCSTWPPAGARPATWFLHGTGSTGGTRRAGTLSAEAPAADEPPDTFIYDPQDPVPTLWSAAMFTQPPNRRRLEYRDDVLYYLSPVLAADLDVAGEPEVVLHASSSAPDTDFFARLVDDDPAGRALEVSYGMLRARHRHSPTREDLLRPGETAEFKIRLGPTACRFRRGHRIRLEITSSDFPNHDRNHNIGRNDLFDAEMAKASQTVMHTAKCPSRLVLPVVSD